MNVCFWSYWAQYATRNAVQILTIDKMVTLVEMQDFYLKKRKRHAVLNNVIWCHLLHWVSFLFCKKTQDMVLISCNFSNLSWNLINHTQFFKYQYIIVFPDIFISQNHGDSLLLFFITGTLDDLSNTRCSIFELIKFHYDCHRPICVLRWNCFYYI